MGLERRIHQLALVAVEIAFAAENAIPDKGTKNIVDQITLIKVVSVLN